MFAWLVFGEGGTGWDWMKVFRRKNESETKPRGIRFLFLVTFKVAIVWFYRESYGKIQPCERERCAAVDWGLGSSFQWWRKVEVLKHKWHFQLLWGYCNKLSWVYFPPTLAHRKISSPAQRASLSLVKFQDYTIIHPTEEAEDNTLAGEETSKNTVQALTFHARLFLEQFWIGRSVHVSAYTHHQVGGLLFSVAAKLLSAGGGGDLCSRHLMGN